MQELIDWFEHLGSTEQLDEMLIRVMNNVVTWIHELSLNQRVVVAVSAFAFIIILKYMSRYGLRVFISLRRWLRRKCIPKKVNLHLDREQKNKD
ncbi:hypothetical protein DBX26_25025 (plasmid) [Vibrio sp. dhg]|nr:hypothetical protein DBX26_25025 [Vibrio sp. dhg]